MSFANLAWIQSKAYHRGDWQNLSLDAQGIGIGMVRELALGLGRPAPVCFDKMAHHSRSGAAEQAVC